MRVRRQQVHRTQVGARGRCRNNERGRASRRAVPKSSNLRWDVLNPPHDAFVAIVARGYAVVVVRERLDKFMLHFFERRFRVESALANGALKLAVFGHFSPPLKLFSDNPRRRDLEAFKTSCQRQGGMWPVFSHACTVVGFLWPRALANGLMPPKRRIISRCCIGP